MDRDTIIAAKERINELRAKQRGHSIQEIKCAEAIQMHIKEQSRLEDEIISWTIHLDSCQMKRSESAWDQLRRKIGI